MATAEVHGFIGNKFGYEVGLAALKAWMQEIGLPLTISEIGATPDMIPGITEGTICYPAGYLDLKPEDITEILKESLR